jgi:hypothetical protein
MIQLSKQEKLRSMQLWNDWGNFIIMILDRLITESIEEIVRKDTEWETLRQSIEFCAKKQVLIYLKKLLEKHYD